METWRIETVIAPDHVLTLRGLSFHAGEQVEVIILSRAHKPNHPERYPLHGSPVRYDNPFASVAEQDFENRAVN